MLGRLSKAATLGSSLLPVNPLLTLWKKSKNLIGSSGWSHTWWGLSLDIHEWAASPRAHQGNSHSRNLLTQFTQSLSESTLHSHCGISTDPANPAQNTPQNKPFPLSMDISYHHYQNNIKLQHTQHLFCILSHPGHLEYTGDMHKSHTRTMGSEMKDLSLYGLGTCPTHEHLPRGLHPRPAHLGLWLSHIHSLS